MVSDTNAIDIIKCNVSFNCNFVNNIMLKKSVVDKLTAAVFIIVALCAIIFRSVSPVVFILAAGVLGILVRVFLQKKKEEEP